MKVLGWLVEHRGVQVLEKIEECALKLRSKYPILFLGTPAHVNWLPRDDLAAISSKTMDDFDNLGSTRSEQQSLLNDFLFLQNQPNPLPKPVKPRSPYPILTPQPLSNVLQYLKSEKALETNCPPNPHFYQNNHNQAFPEYHNLNSSIYPATPAISMTNHSLGESYQVPSAPPTPAQQNRQSLQSFGHLQPSSTTTSMSRDGNVVPNPNPWLYSTPMQPCSTTRQSVPPLSLYNNSGNHPFQPTLMTNKTPQECRQELRTAQCIDVMSITHFYKKQMTEYLQSAEYIELQNQISNIEFADFCIASMLCQKQLIEEALKPIYFQTRTMKKNIEKLQSSVLSSHPDRIPMNEFKLAEYNTNVICNAISELKAIFQEITRDQLTTIDMYQTQLRYRVWQYYHKTAYAQGYGFHP
jgi:hypothetical protein